MKALKSCTAFFILTYFFEWAFAFPYPEVVPLPIRYIVTLVGIGLMAWCLF